MGRTTCIPVARRAGGRRADPVDDGAQRRRPRRGWLILGTGGSERIRGALTRVITPDAQWGRGSRRAVEARGCMWTTRASSRVEPGLPEEQIEQLHAWER